MKGKKDIQTESTATKERNHLSIIEPSFENIVKIIICTSLRLSFGLEHVLKMPSIDLWNSHNTSLKDDIDAKRTKEYISQISISWEQ